MYTNYFGLSKAPFKITPDPAFFFSGGNRGAILEALLYAVSRGEGIVKVVGEVGSGKTMLCRMLEHELPDDCEIVYLANPRLSPDEILQAIAGELDLTVDRSTSKLEIMRLLHAYLLDKHANNRRVVMFIEEAQGMALDTLEEIRLLSNLETTQDKLLQIVLFGQPELDEKLALHEIRQLKERITYAFDLSPLKRDEIRDYVNTRIRTSGFRGNDLFSPAAIRALERHSRGLLRRINILADKALLAAFANGERLVKPKHLNRAALDSEFTGSRLRTPRAVFAGVLAACLALAAGIWWLGDYLPGASASPGNASLGQAPASLGQAPTFSTSKVGMGQAPTFSTSATLGRARSVEEVQEDDASPGQARSIEEEETSLASLGQARSISLGQARPIVAGQARSIEEEETSLASLGQARSISLGQARPIVEEASLGQARSMEEETLRQSPLIATRDFESRKIGANSANLEEIDVNISEDRDQETEHSNQERGAPIPSASALHPALLDLAVLQADTAPALEPEKLAHWLR